MLEYAKQLLGKLARQSNRLNWKVKIIQEDVETLKCGFDTLQKDVTVLESASSELLAKSYETGTCLEEHSKQTEYDLSKVLNNRKATAEAAESFVEFAHPCGRPEWRQVVYLDFSDDNTDCPSGWTQTNYAGKPHTCGRTQPRDLACDATSFPVDGTYSRVCGRITAYQFNIPVAFGAYYFFNFGLGFPYLSGVSLTHGGTFENPVDVPTHIWSFTSGISQSLDDSFLNNPAFKCPCNGGLDPPPYVADDYFCESGVDELTDENVADFLRMFHGINNPLWDGKGCAESSTCCSRINHPYFIKQLDVSTSNPIDARICLSSPVDFLDFAVELVEIYVQ